MAMAPIADRYSFTGMEKTDPRMDSTINAMIQAAPLSDDLKDAITNLMQRYQKQIQDIMQQNKESDVLQSLLDNMNDIDPTMEYEDDE